MARENDTQRHISSVSFLLCCLQLGAFIDRPCSIKKRPGSGQPSPFQEQVIDTRPEAQILVWSAGHMSCCLRALADSVSLANQFSLDLSMLNWLR